MRALLKFIALMLVSGTVSGQTSSTDTMRIGSLLTEGERCLDKSGTEKLDLDSALHFASQAATLSKRLGYSHGIQRAALLKAGTFCKGEEWPRAWAQYPMLDDTGRISFLSTMTLYFLLREQGKPALTDSAGRCVALLEPMIKHIRTSYALGRSYAALVNYYAQKHDNNRAVAIALEGLRLLRRSDDISAENEYVGWISASIAADSGLIPSMTSIVYQLIADDNSLLTRVSSAQQRAAIRDLVTTAINYHLARKNDFAMYIDSMAIRLNERFHQRETLPYNNLSFMYVLQGKSSDALFFALETIRVSEAPEGPVDAVGYEAASRAYSVAGRNDKCLEYFYKALPIIIKDPGAVYNVGAMFVRAVDALLQRNDPAEALRIIRIIRDPAHSFHLDQMGRAYSAMSLANCFFALGRKDSAQRYYIEAIRLVHELDGVRKIEVYKNAAIFYTAIKEYTKAAPFLDTLAADSLHPLIFASYQELLWRLRYRVDSALSNYQGAMAALGKYAVLHDSLTNAGMNKQLAELDVKYETEKKNQHIADLEHQSTLQTRLQQATVRQDRIVRNSLIAGAALLALLATVLYNRWRTRRRMSLQLEKLSAKQQKLLNEKEWLLREIHHRVKNNLQIIISLLNMQAGLLKDEIAVSAFQEIGTRVNTISLIHKKLYQETEDMASINMDQYIRELVGFLRECLGTGNNIAFDLDIQEIVLDVTQCVPVGLILNEAVTNAIKYAFRGTPTRSPVVTISLKEEAGSTITLVVADNGNGLPSDFDLPNAGSLGFQLIQTLSWQLEGSLDIRSRNGLTLVLSFPWIMPMTAGTPPSSPISSAHNPPGYSYPSSPSRYAP